jgi:16S rRNA (cytidine1402-2'-O)-methyltransferase
VVLARELSKLFESIHVCPLAEARDWLLADANRQRGEFVVLVSGGGVAGRRCRRRKGRQAAARRGTAGQPGQPPGARAITGVGRKALYELALRLKA